MIVDCERQEGVCILFPTNGACCRGLLGTVSTIAREEGLGALWKGIVPGLYLLLLSAVSAACWSVVIEPILKYVQGCIARSFLVVFASVCMNQSRTYTSGIIPLDLLL